MFLGMKNYEDDNGTYVQIDDDDGSKLHSWNGLWSFKIQVMLMYENFFSLWCLSSCLKFKWNFGVRIKKRQYDIFFCWSLLHVSFFLFKINSYDNFFKHCNDGMCRELEIN